MFVRRVLAAAARPARGLGGQQRQASVLASKLSDRDALTVWRQPLAQQRQQSQRDTDEFARRQRVPLYQYMGSDVPRAGQLKSNAEYVLGLSPVDLLRRPESVYRELRELRHAVGELKRAPATKRAAPAQRPASARVGVAAAGVVAGGGGLYFYFA
ncbi:hypothetical protein IWW55_000431 [Coemansia sp. RSA 2706]|nr:hypothetical protein LPJ63_004882 [Coemansia sp. RSA 2711]KAJ2308448.1 hypothetical protein IWW55_000431 [Coemansia sp. RSA 2706]KAJ2309105.1 hypothetical protein IWW54_003915 [Coemansia sp. RSA 2705]KAJ2322369.1 hypothetical protein IWW52_000105 [Coemansia sp. RSA 2704]KAJ2368660.1 hypothetical protein H4S01_001466 [Coemansia sp. RSA 2610]KAJ2390024.1 hypothetical protein H4S02_002073 [Coemansia sp. RSA 2611]KAJ2738312.1 hypothetical protein H4R23_001237 [Coemansia sp. Cherry 401B]